MRNYIETTRHFSFLSDRRIFSYRNILLVFLLMGLTSCGDTRGAGKEDTPDPPPFAGTLYVTNGNNGKLLAFDPPAISKSAAQTKLVPRVVDGNVPPSRQFPDAVSGPSGLYLDRTNDILYVANSATNAILIYEKASTLTAPSSASRVIAGDQTLLSQPFAVTFNAATGRLFVSNRGTNSITTFQISCNGATALKGNIAPCTRLIGEITQLDFPRALAVDSQKKMLYISNMGNDSILVYKNIDLPNALGDLPQKCKTDFALCNIAPAQVISPHIGTENVSKLELPFGIFIDAVNDRLYVVNTGLNRPAVFIYEGASGLNGGVVPGRVISGLKTDLTVPTGIDVDVTGDRIFVVNNNSPNNVNTSTGNNTGSPSLVIFNNLMTTCPVATAPCNISPDGRLGGDVSAETTGGTTLSSPLGVAFDPGREITYIANTGENNILFYSLDGNISPIKMNAGVTSSANTRLQAPSNFFYDAALDRLYISHAVVGTTIPAFPVTVYDKISDQPFGENGQPPTKPSWVISGDSNFGGPRGVYIDKTRRRMVILNDDGSAFPRFGLYLFDVDNFTNSKSDTNNSTGNSDGVFPLSNGTINTAETTLGAPSFLRKYTTGLSAGGPTGMAVDEVKGEVYVADKGNNAVVVYNYAGVDLTPVRIITGLNKPSGVFLDTQRDILYVTNNGEESGATLDHTKNTVFVFSAASTRGDNSSGCKGSISLCTKTAPTRIISTAGIVAGSSNKLKAPVSPYVDLATDRLFLINAANLAADQNAVFSFDQASTQGDSSSGCISTGPCTDTPPAKVIIGAKTLLDYSNVDAKFAGGLLLAKQNEKETLYVGQSVDPVCNPPGGTTCSKGALLAFGIEGKAPPSRIWSGGGGVFSSPEAVAIDSTKNILYVANQTENTISILKNADKVDVTLDATIGKQDLNITGLNKPSGLFIDAAQDRLYVSSNTSIQVYNNVSTLIGTSATPPSETISDLLLTAPEGITVDTTRKRLYVANPKTNALLVFNISATASFDTMLSGLNKPTDVAIDATRDILYLLNRGKKEVLVFQAASTLTGSSTPTRIIAGSDLNGNSLLDDPSAIFIDPGKDLLYLADRGGDAIYIFPDASNATREPITKTLSGDLTILSSPSAITVNTASP